MTETIPSLSRNPRVRFRAGLLLAVAVLLTACNSTVDDRIVLYRDYCAKVGYSAESEGMRNCIVQMEAARRSYHVHR